MASKTLVDQLVSSGAFAAAVDGVRETVDDEPLLGKVVTPLEPTSASDPRVPS